MKILIVANGANISQPMLHNLAEKADTIIAADGGANLCSKGGIIPDCIIGDFDSITSETKVQFQKVEKIIIREQETTDLEKALAYARTLKPDEINVCSLFGNRLDHTFANAVIIQNFARENSIPITLFDDSGVLKIWSSGKRKLRVQIGKAVSFFSLGKIVQLTLKGFHYEVHQQNFMENFTGISNSYAAHECIISFSEGILFHYEPADDED